MQDAGKGAVIAEATLTDSKDFTSRRLEEGDGKRAH